MKAIYLSSIDPNYSRSGVYFEGDKGSKEFVRVPRSKLEFLKLISKISSENSVDSTVLVVMSPNHILVAWLKIFSKFQVVLDAGWPLSDSIPNGTFLTRATRNLKNYTVDYISFKLANKIILESNEQLDFVSEKFSIHKSKLHQLFTGFNESAYEKSQKEIIPLECIELESSESRFILFRGKVNPESGIELILEAATALETEMKFVIVTNRVFTKIAKNTTLISRYLSEPELLWLYRNATAVLGQISNQDRLARTIPHKLFEAAYFSKCYLSPSSKGLLNFLSPSQFISVDEISLAGLMSSIRLAVSDESLRSQCEELAKMAYSASASQTILSDRFRKIIESF